MKRHNLSSVFVFEILRTIRKKQFWILTFLIPLILGGFFAVIANSDILEDRATDPQSTSLTEPIIYQDDSGFISPQVAVMFNATTNDVSQSENIDNVRAAQIGAFFHYPADLKTQQIGIYAQELNLFQNIQYATLAQALLKASLEENLTPQERALLASPPTATLTTFEDGQEALGIESIFIPALFLALFFLAMVLLGNQLLLATTEEKERRISELILTSTSPTTLLLGKVFSTLTLGFIQIIAYIVPIAALAFFMFLDHNFSSLLPLDAPRSLTAAGLFLASLAFFVGLLLGIGSIMPTAKDASSVFAIFIILLIIPIYASGFILTAPEGIFAQILLFFPFTAPMTSLLLNALGILPFWQALIIIAELAILAIIILRVSATLFHYGSFSYTKKIQLRTLLQLSHTK